MIDYRPLQEVIAHLGLRILLVRGIPSPWGQAAKTIFELKGLDYLVGPFESGGANEDILAWAGVNSAPIVAWAGEKPIHHWLDILFLAERLQPSVAMIPADPRLRAKMLGLSHEICGELGIGWNRRLQMFSPGLENGQADEGLARMGEKYRYNREDFKRAGQRTAGVLHLLHDHLKHQYQRGIPYFIGDSLSALDIYWTAFANFLDPLPTSICAMPEFLRPSFIATDPQIRKALSPMLLEHRDKIFRECFRSPMEF